MQIEQLVKDLQAKGLANDQILQSLQKMVEENRITGEDFEKVKVSLTNTQPGQTTEPDQEEVDKQRIGKWFGMTF